MANLDNSLSILEIKKISSKKSAITGKIYKGEDGIRYLGLEDKTLLRIPPITGEVTGDLKSSQLNNIGDYSRDEIVALLTQITINQTNTINNTNTKASKCYAAALAVSL